MIMLDIENLTITYGKARSRVKAVEKVSFHVDKGERIGIIGESGSGKTSLALAIMGLVSAGSVTGRVLFKKKNLLEMSTAGINAYRWKSIAMVFQNSLEVLNPVLTVGHQIGEPLKTHYHLSDGEVEERVISLMTRVGLSPEWRHQYPHHLSGGMRQRCLIAMAISCEPDILIVDEPTTSLDPESSREILDLIETVLDRTGAALIMISHNMPAVRRLTSRVLTLYCGHVVEEGNTAAVLARPMHCYTRGLLNASPDLFVYKDLWGIDGEVSVTDVSTGCPFHPRCCQSSIKCSKLRPALRTVGENRRVACHKGGIETLLKARGVFKSYQLNNGKSTEKKLSVLNGVNIDIRRGEIIGLVGKSGSGKSTLAHVLVNAVKPDGGEILFEGKKVGSDSVSGRMEGMQMVFQDPFSSVSSRMCVMDAVKEPLEIMGWKDMKARRAQVVKFLLQVSLPVDDGFLNRRTQDLSGGQRQRVAVARALVTRPRLVIADEITSMLDPSTKANLLRELKGIQNKEGFSMLFITHDLFVARKISDRILKISQGRVEECTEREAYRFLAFSDYPN